MNLKTIMKIELKLAKIVIKHKKKISLIITFKNLNLFKKNMLTNFKLKKREILLFLFTSLKQNFKKWKRRKKC